MAILTDFLKTIGNFSLRYKLIIIGFLVIWFLWPFGLGLLGGWLLAKGSLSKFPEIKKTDKILVLAPHIDDEIIGAAGIIQQANQIGAKIMIVYATNGDDNPISVLGQNKNYDPNDFISLGEKRMVEGKIATSQLGLNNENLIFLGYPDSGLDQMLNKFFYQDTAYTAKATRLNYNPYQGTYRENQLYNGSNLSTNLGEIIDKFSPTIIITPHPRDAHPDHRALFYFLEKVLNERNIKVKKYAYLVHFRLYPPQKKLEMNKLLYPPKKLFSQEGWYSFDLSPEQEKKKLEAINQNLSQLKVAAFEDLLRSFVKKNEIFEEFE